MVNCRYLLILLFILHLAHNARSSDPLLSPKGVNYEGKSRRFAPPLPKMFLCVTVEECSGGSDVGEE